MVSSCHPEVLEGGGLMVGASYLTPNYFKSHINIVNYCIMFNVRGVISDACMYNKMESHVGKSCARGL